MWGSLWHSLPSLLRGLSVNVTLLLCLILVGLLAGVVVALVQTYAHRSLACISIAYVWFFRGVPEIVLLMLVYFGLRQLGVGLSPFLAAIIALGLRSSAYQSQIFRGAIQTVGKGQSLAALSLGMTRVQAIARVVLPQALRLSVPAWSNEFTSAFKDTTLAYTIGVVEVLRNARYLVARDFGLVLPAFIAVALLFLVLIIAANLGLQKLSDRFRIPGLEQKVEAGRRE